MNEKSIIRVRDVMKHDYDMVDGMTTIQVALDSMKFPENKCLVVDKRHADDEYGLVLFSGIAKNVLSNDLAADRINAYEVMIKPVITVRADMNIRYCARMFSKFHVSRAPVLEQEQIVGIVSFGDLVLRGVRGRGR